MDAPKEFFKELKGITVGGVVWFFIIGGAIGYFYKSSVDSQKAVDYNHKRIKELETEMYILRKENQAYTDKEIQKEVGGLRNDFTDFKNEQFYPQIEEVNEDVDEIRDEF